MTLRSNFTEGTTPWAVRRAQWRALGLTDDDMTKPKIAVVNTSSELSSCFIHLDELAAEVKQGVREGGGIPFEIRTAAPSDFITNAGKGARYLMPARDLIVNDIEVAVEGAMLDGMVCLASCDKTTPGQLMAAARLDIPTVVAIGGYQASGTWCGRSVDIEDVFESVGATSTGSLSLDELREMTDVAVCGPGVCAGMGTANTMHLAAEALGMTLPGSAPAAGGGNRVRELAKAAGQRVVECVHEDLRPRQVMSDGAFANAVRACLAVSGSINALRHLQAVATEAESAVDVYALFDRLGPQVPLLAAVRPNGPVPVTEFDRAGGTSAVLAQLADQLDTEAITVSGHTVGELVAATTVADDTVVRPMRDPVAPGPSVVLPRGSLAPEGSIVKLGLGSRELSFRGPAKVFERQEEALTALGDGTVEPGDVVILRGLGPRGGPGVASASWFVAALGGAGLADQVAVVTDGQLSGLNHGIVVGQVCPEAATGGPIALVADGDEVRIDIPRRRVDLLIPDDEWRRRESRWEPPEPGARTGYLAQYAELVQPLSRGAVLRGPSR